jgi:hypothetical protein
MGGHGVPLNKAPCSSGEAGDPKPRANPANGIKDINKYLEVSLAGKRFIININISPRRLAVVKRQERARSGIWG